MTMRRFRRMRRRPAPTTDTRSPDERLEGLVREPNDDRRHRMLDRILEGFDAAPDTVGHWITAARTLSDRLIISFKAFHYFAYTFAADRVLYGADTDADLARLEEELDAVARAHGLSQHQSFHADDAPEEWTALEAAWDARMDTLVAELIRSAGHADVADALLRDRAAFQRQVEEGYAELRLGE